MAMHNDDRPPALNINTDTQDEAVLGIAISRQQTRLTSPLTPAVEKEDILRKQEGFFSDIASRPIPEVDGVGETIAQHTNFTYSTQPDVLGVGQAKPEQPRSEASRSFLRSALTTRRRASSGPESTLDSLQKAILSIPKKLSLVGSQNDDDSTVTRREHASETGPVQDRSDVSWRPSAGQHPDQRQHHPLRTTAAVGHLHQGGYQPPRTPSLRRTVSDESLALSRAFSQVSSLGDDSRFQDIHAQVNSRFKAIRDSWQETSIKLPSIPSIASLKSEFFGSSQDRLDQSPAKHSSRPVDPITRSPYHTLHDAATDIGDSSASPNLSTALAHLEGDVVVLGGYRGSILRSSTPPHKQLWVPIKVGLNLRKVDLEVGLGVEDDLKPAKDIIPGGMLNHIGPVDISRRLFKRLRSADACRQGKLRVHDYGYDWRLDPTFLSQQLCAFLERLPCNQSSTPPDRRGATVIAHSLGGLITRYAVNHRPELFRGVVYAGVPTRCVNILGPLRNGDDVLLSSRVLTAQVNFTIRTSFALFPLDGRCFIDKQTNEEYPVDFFDAKTYLDYRLTPCIARPLVALKQSSGIMSTVAKALPSLPAAAARRISISRSKFDTSVEGVAEPDTMSSSQGYRQPANASADQLVEPTVSTAVTIPFDEAYAYLERTLANVKRFKQKLDFRADHADANRYPPIAVIYGKNTPTVVGARVNGLDGIRRADAYDDLVFGSGDGVVLARAAMLPEGYTAARGGVISSERGHVSLLGDLEAVGKAITAIMKAKDDGVGCTLWT